MELIWTIIGLPLAYDAMIRYSGQKIARFIRESFGMTIEM